MRAYVGQTRSRRLIAELARLGVGECTQPTELPPRRRPWFLDNGAYAAWKAGATFDAGAFESALATAETSALGAPDFVVCPDIVAGGARSLALSLEWMARCSTRGAALRWYLALQDGMTTELVAPAAGQFAGLFVGGTLEWKLSTGATWVALGRELDRPVHVGRCGTAKRVRWAKRIGAASIDSCLPLWSARKLALFAAALEAPQMELF